MSLYRLIDIPVFPDPREADEDGLLAVGGDLRVKRLLNAYAHGIFPWYEDRTPILWWSPPKRAIFLPGDERLPERARRALKTAAFEVRVDTCFADVIARCQKTPRKGQDGTWITESMRKAYVKLYEKGYAHSFETFRNGELVGGLYGISLGVAFFGESMFSQVDYASRAAFVKLCETCWAWGFHFIDGQLPNHNLTQLGARVITREEFLDRLASAMAEPTRKGLWQLAVL